MNETLESLRPEAVRDGKGANLTLRTQQALRKRIEDGPIKVGEKLPTEKALAAEFGVSRTVIREAIIALRADGILKAVHGVGYFVSDKPAGEQEEGARNFVLAPTSSRLDLLEFRMAVEIHAAGLAAARRSWAQDEKIWTCAAKFEEALRGGAPTEQADWGFHRSISEATNNQVFLQFFDQLGVLILPRQGIKSETGGKIITRKYLEKSIAEHRAICQAISDSNIDAARAAMQAHLGKSHLLYRGLEHPGDEEQ